MSAEQKQRKEQRILAKIVKAARAKDKQAVRELNARLARIRKA